MSAPQKVFTEHLLSAKLRGGRQGRVEGGTDTTKKKDKEGPHCCLPELTVELEKSSKQVT